MSMDASSGSGDGGNIKGVPTHGGRYVRYNVYGNFLEVSAKYVPPIRPVGRGAYGIVWYALDVHVERAADVLMHKRLLHLAHDPANRPAIEVRLVQMVPTGYSLPRKAQE